MDWTDDQAREAAKLSVGKQVKSLASAMAWLVKGSMMVFGKEKFLQKFWAGPTAGELLKILTFVAEWTGSSCTIQKVEVCMAHMHLWKKVKYSDETNTIKRFLNNHRAIAKEAKYDEFWDVRVFLDKVRPWIEDLDKACSYKIKHRKYDCQLMARSRSTALVLLRIAMIGRRVDVYRIKAYKFAETVVDVINKVKEIILWVCTRRKQKGNYRWEPILPNTEDTVLCPVRAFRRYLETAQLSLMWSGRPMRTEHGEDMCVWRSSMPKQAYQKLVCNGHHYGIAPDTISGDCKRILDIGEVDTVRWKADSIRGATASIMVEMGVPNDQIMDRGGWLDAMVFQKYYNRGGRKVNWMVLLSKSLELNRQSSEKQLENSKDNFATDIRQVLEELKKGQNEFLRDLLDLKAVDVKKFSEEYLSNSSAGMEAVASPQYNELVRLDRGEARPHTSSAARPPTPSSTDTSTTTTNTLQVLSATTSRDRKRDRTERDRDRRDSVTVSEEVERREEQPGKKKAKKTDKSESRTKRQKRTKEDAGKEKGASSVEEEFIPCSANIDPKGQSSGVKRKVTAKVKGSTGAAPTTTQ